MPGMIDSHMHNVGHPAPRRDLLLGGVTSVCDLGSALAYMPAFEERTYFQDPVARGFKAGPIITVPGGLPGKYSGVDINYEVATPEEARAAVIDLKTRGADVIKIYLEPYQDVARTTSYPMLSQEQVNAIVDEAHQQGLIVRAHVTTTTALEIALAGGVDVIEHEPVVDLTADELASIM